MFYIHQAMFLKQALITETIKKKRKKQERNCLRVGRVAEISPKSLRCMNVFQSCLDYFSINSNW